MSESFGHDPENNPVSARHNPRSRFQPDPPPARREPSKAVIVALIVIPVAVFGIPDFWSATWTGASAFLLIIVAFITWAESGKGRADVARALVGFSIYAGFSLFAFSSMLWRKDNFGSYVLFGTAALSAIGWSASPRPRILTLFFPDMQPSWLHQDDARCEITRVLVGLDALILLAL